jgi:membrane dipeptidase
MNELGILVDVSHLSDGGFYDVAKISKKPFVATHSDCRALAAHPRNLTDDMIRLLAQKGGVSGINFAPAFLDDTQGNKTSRISDMVRHVKHFIEIGGEDCVGIGTDFDGIGGNLEVGEPGRLTLLFEALEKAGITPRQIDKIASGNVLRVMKETMRPRFE